jgi:WD40 repeat protein
MQQASLCTLVISTLSAILAVCQVPPSAVVATTSGSTLSLYDAAGTVVQRIDLTQPVAGFAFSPDRSKLVVVSPDTEHGGALILIDLKNGARRKLTSSHFAFHHLNEGETEVYDSPAFSPDGRKLAFAVHGNQPGDGNDAWENSGPLAVLDFDTRKLRVLKATDNVDGNGPCSESDPQWSPDGKWILFNCQEGALLTDAQGSTIRDLNISTDNAGSSAVGWVGGHCILYVQTPLKQGHFDFGHESEKLLELRHSQSFDATKMLSKFSPSTGGLQQASTDALIRWEKSRLIIETVGKQWELPMQKRPNEPQTVLAQLLTAWEPRAIPDYCK